jgi:hypothetical protein
MKSPVSSLFSSLVISAAVFSATLVGPTAARAQSQSAPVISSASSLDVYYQVELQGGNAFSYRIVASGSPTGYGASGLPATTTLTSSTGWLYGNASYPGLYSVTLSASNAVGTGTAPLRLAIHPAIIGVSNSGNKAYPAGSTLTISVRYNSPVGVIGTPSVVLSLSSPAAGTRVASYVSGSGSDTLLFAYTPGATDVSSSVAAISTLNLNGGSIRDANGLDAGAALPAHQTSSAFSAVSFTASANGSGANSASIAPSFLGQPQDQSIAAGSTVMFAAQATAPTSVSYQWTHDGAAISGATSPTLLLGNTGAADAGSYAAIATTSAGSVTSSSATLRVVASSNPGRLLNLSILSGVQGTLTLGFVIGGAGATGTENLLIRGLGPALNAFGVNGLLADPILTTIQQNSKAVLATNAGWNGQHAVITADAVAGAFPLSDPASADSAVVVPLSTSTGGYTVQVAGKSGDSGTALAEVYDATSGYFANTPHLINLSCLTPVTAGGSLSAGFVVGGDTAKTVLIRALGPALGAFGVTGTMPDPQVTLRALGSTSALATAQGSAGAGDLSAVAASVGAFQIASATSADSAIVVTLPPGGYTANVSSVSGAAGNVLVEVYEVP